MKDILKKLLFLIFLDGLCYVHAESIFYYDIHLPKTMKMENIYYSLGIPENKHKETYIRFITQGELFGDLILDGKERTLIVPSDEVLFKCNLKNEGDKKYVFKRIIKDKREYQKYLKSVHKKCKYQDSNKKNNYQSFDEESNRSFKIYASPFKWKKVNREKDISYGTEFRYDHKNTEILLQYDRNQFSSTDVLSGVTVEFADHDFNYELELKRLWGEFSYFMNLKYKREREGTINIIEHSISAGPIGFKYDFVKNSKYLKECNLSYIPLYEYLAENIEDFSSGNIASTFFNRNISRNIRNSFRFLFLFTFDEQETVTLQNTSYYRPAYDLDQGKMNADDYNIENVFNLKLNIGSNFYLNLKNKFIYDKRAKFIRKLPSTDLINSINLEYSTYF